jgi:hypothetical protein
LFYRSKDHNNQPFQGQKRSKSVCFITDFRPVLNSPAVSKQQPDDLVNLAGCLNLVSNAVIVWNTVYMQAAIEELRRRGHTIDEADFVHLSPVRFKHINRYGKFRFDIGDDLALTGLRPLRFD